MLSCIFVHVRVYILFFYEFLWIQGEWFNKDSLRNIDTLANQMRGHTPLVWSLARVCLPVFSVKVKNRDEEMWWDVCGAGKGRTQGKSSPVTQVSSQGSGLTFHSCGIHWLLLPISTSFSGTLESPGKFIFRIWLIDSECILPS